MKNLHCVFLILLFTIGPTILGQQFVLEWEIGKNLQYIGDMDGNGVAEFVSNNTDSIQIFEYMVPNIKWEITNQGIIDSYHQPDFNRNALYIDFNNDNIKDIIVSQDYKLKIVDPSTRNIIFEYTSVLYQYPHISAISDFDNDGIVEIQIVDFPDMVFYSTGISPTNIKDVNNFNPQNFGLSQNYPNPFNPTTTIEYSISSPQEISIKIYNVSGQLIKEIRESHNQAGEYQVVWNGKNNFGERVSSGSYFYQLVIGNYSEAKKMILLK